MSKFNRYWMFLGLGVLCVVLSALTGNDFIGLASVVLLVGAGIVGEIQANSNIISISDWEIKDDD